MRRHADQIPVIEEARIVERNKHSELVSLGGRYYDLYTRQHGLEMNLFLAPGEGDTSNEDAVEAAAVHAGWDRIDPFPQGHNL